MATFVSPDWKATKRVRATAELLMSSQLDGEAVYQFLCDWKKNQFCPVWLPVLMPPSIFLGSVRCGETYGLSAVFSAGGGLYFQTIFEEWSGEMHVTTKIVRPNYICGSRVGERKLEFHAVDKDMQLFNSLIENIGQPPSADVEQNVQYFTSSEDAKWFPKINWDRVFEFYRTTKKDMPKAELVLFPGLTAQMDLSAYRRKDEHYSYGNSSPLDEYNDIW